MNIIIRGKRDAKELLVTSDLKIIIDGKEEHGIQKITFDADASRGSEIVMITLELIPESLMIEGDFKVEQKVIDGLICKCGSQSIWTSKEALIDMMHGKWRGVVKGGVVKGDVTIVPSYVEVNKREYENEYE